jgi:hypothetical protein
VINERELHKHKQTVYKIRVKGRLDRNWSDWFDGFTVNPQADDETALSGSVVDQAHLRCILERLFDLSLTLLSVTRIEMESAEMNSRGENRYETGH